LLNNDKITKGIVLSGIPGLKGTLRDFQTIGVAFAESKDGRILNSDEQGLGKTIETLAWIQLHRDRIPVIIVCPASLKLNWEREIITWIPNPKIEILSGKTPYKTKGDILIINYDIVSSWIEELRRRKPQILVLDEAHKIKSNAAQRTKAIKKIEKGIPHLFGLTGTPIKNKPIEIYNIVNLIDKTLFPNYIAFTRRYCNAHSNGFGIDVSGASNTQELHDKLTSTILIRRKKEDVLKELPDKIYSFLPIEIDNEKEYREAEKDFIAYVRREKGNEAAKRIESVEALAKIEGLKQLAVKGKLKEAIEWIKDFLESDNKLVVFCTHKFVIDKLMEEFKHIAVKIDGSVTIKDRQRSVDIFQHNPECKLFVGNEAAEEGLTLTASSYVFHLEYPWSPTSIDQRNDRCHRIGQKDNVTVYYPFAQNTIEEKIAKMLDEKRKIISSVVDGKETEQGNLLHEIMKSYL
jgi:SNF2 family DNA or RNA helicase